MRLVIMDSFLQVTIWLLQVPASQMHLGGFVSFLGKNFFLSASSSGIQTSSKDLQYNALAADITRRALVSHFTLYMRWRDDDVTLFSGYPLMTHG